MVSKPVTCSFSTVAGANACCKRISASPYGMEIADIFFPAGLVTGLLTMVSQRHRWAEGCYQSNVGICNTWAAPQADCLHATPHWCSNSGSQTKIWVHKWTRFRRSTFLHYKSLVLCNILIFWDTRFLKSFTFWSHRKRSTFSWCSYFLVYAGWCMSWHIVCTFTF